MSTEGLISVFNVSELPSTHPDVFSDKGGKAILATSTQGYLVYGPYVTEYPTTLLDVYFSIFIDNNSADDLHILTLDVHDSFQQKILAYAVITRKQFPVAEVFSLFKLSFTPEEHSKLEFRIYYNGYAYIAADKIAVVDPEKLQLKTHDDLVAICLAPQKPEEETPLQPEEEKEETEPILPEMSGDILLSETLQDGKTKGDITDGTLTPEGLQVSGGRWRIEYKIPSTPKGFIEFNARGFVEDERYDNEPEYKSMLLTMWDGQAGYDYNRDFIFDLRKYGYIEGRSDASNAFKLKIKSQGEWMESPYYRLTWDQNKIYRIRVEWGGGNVRVLRDGQEVAKGTYHAEFAPSDHRIQIGASSRKEAPQNLLISDVVIGKL